MERLLWVCLAGGLGTGLRYGVNLWALRSLGSNFPFGTLIVNLTGCFLMALILQVAASLPAFPVDLRVAVTTGFLGGLTTYSSFNHETSALFASGARGTALINFALTTFGALACGLAGQALGRRLFGAAL